MKTFVQLKLPVVLRTRTDLFTLSDGKQYEDICTVETARRTEDKNRFVHVVGGKQYEDIRTVETARRSEDTNRFLDVVRARKL
jgi:hypothetical protein